MQTHEKQQTMNNKENELNRIVDAVVRCCGMSGNDSITRNKLLSKCKEANVVMARSILVCAVLAAGYTISTCTLLIGCTPQTARALFTKDTELVHTSNAYRIARNDVFDSIGIK